MALAVRWNTAVPFASAVLRRGPTWPPFHAARCCSSSSSSSCSSSAGGRISRAHDALSAATPSPLLPQPARARAGALCHSALAAVAQRPLSGVATSWPATVSLCGGLHGRSALVGPAGRLSCRAFAAEASPRLGEAKLSASASKALGSIKQTMKKTTQLHLTKAQKRTFQGHLRRYKLMGGRPEFHNIDLNKHGRIFEPWHNFEVIITSSKNNCYITVKNKGWKYRTVIQSHAGNVGFRKANKKTEGATNRIAMNIARKLKRLGVTCAEVTFRKIMKVETCLQAFQSVGLQITRLTHIPRLPKGNSHRPKKKRRV